MTSLRGRSGTGLKIHDGPGEDTFEDLAGGALKRVDVALEIITKFEAIQQNLEFSDRVKLAGVMVQWAELRRIRTQLEGLNGG